MFSILISKKKKKISGKSITFFGVGWDTILDEQVDNKLRQYITIDET
jgi:hypothetical protein